jgi:hypothetical protein
MFYIYIYILSMIYIGIFISLELGESGNEVFFELTGQNAKREIYAYRCV